MIDTMAFYNDNININNSIIDGDIVELENISNNNQQQYAFDRLETCFLLDHVPGAAIGRAVEEQQQQPQYQQHYYDQNQQQQQYHNHYQQQEHQFYDQHQQHNQTQHVFQQQQQQQQQQSQLKQQPDQHFIQVEAKRPSSSSSAKRPSDMSFASAASLSSAATSPIETPEGVNPDDVLCGRDKVSHAHPGNKHFRKIIERFRESYQTAPCREKKTTITLEIVSSIKNIGGRFLKKEADDTWQDVGDTYAREKVSHALRSAKDPNRTKVKKRRVVPKYVPTPKEDAVFEKALDDQQRIFQMLLRNEANGKMPTMDYLEDSS